MSKFTNCQANALQVFGQWLVGDKKYMILKGPAGVGKTFILKEMLNQIANPNLIMTLLGRDPITNTAITALTNKAAEVIGSVMAPMEASTLHSFLKLGMKNDYASGRTKLIRGKDHDIIYNTLVIVDECSMIDTELFQWMEKTLVNCKVLFMGDEPQLGPIYETISPIFLLPPEQCEVVEMTEVVRNRGVPDLQVLCTQLRQSVLTKVFSPIIQSNAVQYLDDAQMQFQMNHDFVLGDRADARILAYSNDRVQLYNQYIREARHLPLEFQPGEVVVCNNAAKNVSGSAMSRVEQEMVIHSIEPVEFDHFIKEQVNLEVPVYTVNTNRGSFIQPVNYAQISWVMKQLAASKSWATYFNIKERFIDLRMKQAATVYKAQGSTYHTVYLDLADIGICKNPDQAARLLYVGATRASHQVYLFGQLPPRFQGII